MSTIVEPAGLFSVVRTTERFALTPEAPAQVYHYVKAPSLGGLPEPVWYCIGDDAGGWSWEQLLGSAETVEIVHTGVPTGPSP